MAAADAKVEVETKDDVKVDIKDMKEDVKASQALAGTGNTMEERVLSQIEYYFGDNNLPRDKFLKTECAKDDGWVKIETLLTFNRLKTHVKELPEEAHVAKIAEIMKASTLVDVDESGLKVRRNPESPLDPNSEERTVYLKGFPKHETKLDDLLEFFKQYVGVTAIIMRNFKEKTFDTGIKSEENGADENGGVAKVVWVKKFKGSILVVFQTAEQATKFLTESDVNYKGNHIEIKMMLADYKKTKREEYIARIEARNKKAKVADGEDTKDEKEGENGKGEDAPKDEIILGALLRVKNLPPDFSREDFKEKWYQATNEEEFKIIFLDFNKGEPEGVIRLEKENAAINGFKLLPDGKLKVDDEKSIDVEVLDGEEEKKYLDIIAGKRLALKRKGGAGGRGGGGRGRGRGRGRGGKRQRRN